MAGVFIREDMDTDFCQDAENIKAVNSLVSITDCFYITLANRLGIEVWTCDRHELKPINCAEKTLTSHPSNNCNIEKRNSYD